MKCNKKAWSFIHYNYKTSNIVALWVFIRYDSIMNDNKMINILSELAHKNRFEIYKLLIRKGDNGLTIGEISKLLAIPLSTLSFHLNGLKDADLITQKKIVRNVYCYAQIDLLTDVLEKLRSECCSEEN